MLQSLNKPSNRSFHIERSLTYGHVIAIHCAVNEEARAYFDTGLREATEDAKPAWEYAACKLRHSIGIGRPRCDIERQAFVAWCSRELDMTASESESIWSAFTRPFTS